MTLQGFDIAGVNGAGIITTALTGAFVLCKATEGKGFDDPLHDSFVTQARTAGKLIGHYHYAWPENGGVVDADHFIARSNAQPGDVLALDFEPFNQTSSPTSWPQYVIDFASRVHSVVGAWPVLYSEEEHLGVLIANATDAQKALIRALPLWKSGRNNIYPQVDDGNPGDLHGWDKAVLWQWGSQTIDKDTFYGDATTWRLVLGVPKFSPQEVQIFGDAITHAVMVSLVPTLNALAVALKPSPTLTAEEVAQVVKGALANTTFATSVTYTTKAV